MLFNSPEFLFLFLPVTLIGFAIFARVAPAAVIPWLLTVSLFFYGYWGYQWLPLLLLSIAANHALGFYLLRTRHNRRKLLWSGIIGNLLTLGYFKYSNFFVATVEAATGADVEWSHVVLPIGISFYTFQQIAFLIDAYRGETKPYGLLRHALFISFFPQLIAGPIVHSKELVPQLETPRRFDWSNLTVGLAVLIIGLVKKTVVADGFAIPASQMFDAVPTGVHPEMGDAWVAVLSYTLQIYFDFSGYSDMAVGLSRMFGVQLPINFASPYKATSISDFWRRWHITLSRFLRDYLYIPLGGNRRGAYSQLANLMLTMMLGGLWHGANWTFLLWGTLHGAFLLINNLWRGSTWRARVIPFRAWSIIAWALTFAAITLAWVPFRAADLTSTLVIWTAMLGLASDSADMVGTRTVIPLMILCLAFVVAAPNTYQAMAAFKVGLPSPGYPATIVEEGRFSFSSLKVWHGFALGLAAGVAVLKLNDVSQFLYFQF